MSEVEAIACATGHHFWECEDDSVAIRIGWDAAQQVMKYLNEQGHRP